MSAFTSASFPLLILGEGCPQGQGEVLDLLDLRLTRGSVSLHPQAKTSIKQAISIIHYQQIPSILKYSNIRKALHSNVLVIH